MLTVPARLFRNRAHAEISTSQQVHAGCGQLVGGLAALGLAVALLASRTGHLQRGDLCWPAVMQSFAGLNIASSSAGPSPRGPGIILPGIGFDPTRALV
jgi:manganese transport protein